MSAWAVAGDASSAELLTEIGGSGVLGYSPGHRWQRESQSDDCEVARRSEHMN
jgi:hypothetical protein